MRLSEFSSGAHKDHGYHNCNVSELNTVTPAHVGTAWARTGSVKITRGGGRGR